MIHLDRCVQSKTYQLLGFNKLAPACFCVKASAEQVNWRHFNKKLRICEWMPVAFAFNSSEIHNDQSSLVEHRRQEQN